MFKRLGFTEEEAQKQFGFLMNAFEFGAPPHGGLAFGFDRLCAVLNSVETIRDFIAFPKNNSGRDVMLDSPSNLQIEALSELSLDLSAKWKILQLLINAKNDGYKYGRRSVSGIAEELKIKKEFVREVLILLVKEKIALSHGISKKNNKDYYSIII